MWLGVIFGAVFALLGFVVIFRASWWADLFESKYNEVSRRNAPDYIYRPINIVIGGVGCIVIGGILIIFSLARA